MHDRTFKTEDATRCEKLVINQRSVLPTTSSQGREEELFSCWKLDSTVSAHSIIVRGEPRAPWSLESLLCVTDHAA